MLELTPHQQRIYILLLTEVTVEQIAAQLGTSKAAVHKTCYRVYGKKGVKNRLELMALRIAELSCQNK